MSLRDEFGISYEQVYRMWASYGMARASGLSPIESIHAMKEAHPEYASDYFIALALELITGKMIEGQVS